METEVTPSRTDAFVVHCATCRHTWTVCKLPIVISRFVKAAKGAAAAGCPKCGAYGRGIVLCGTPDPLGPAGSEIRRNE